MQSNKPSQSDNVSDKVRREEEFRLYLAILRILRKKRAKSPIERLCREIAACWVEDVSSKSDTIGS
jgi:hypothetical protein